MPKNRPTAQVYTTSDVCDILQIDRRTVARLSNKGHIVRVMTGRYTKESVDAFARGDHVKKPADNYTWPTTPGRRRGGRPAKIPDRQVSGASSDTIDRLGEIKTSRVSGRNWRS